MKRSRAASIVTGIGLAALLLGTPAGADWLVTREGVKVETKGPWKVKGKLVVFTRPDDTLASLRISEVDLEASQRLTAAPAQGGAALPAPEKPKEKKWVLTDASFPSRPAAPSAPSGAADDAAAVSPEVRKGVPGKSPVTIGSWRQTERPEGDGLDILGVLQNNGDYPAEEVTLTVELTDLNGMVIATRKAALSVTAIGPGEAVPFHAPFPGIPGFAEARFDIRSQRLMEVPVAGQTTP
ncbi:MAG TPA: FxLYD domain-containing protein [Thermoanaerobaculia bacterium]|nr:FxLYD domain-containing protein [Thermoanaerobaculia bacterium]